MAGSAQSTCPGSSAHPVLVVLISCSNLSRFFGLREKTVLVLVSCWQTLYRLFNCLQTALHWNIGNRQYYSETIGLRRFGSILRHMIQKSVTFGDDQGLWTPTFTLSLFCLRLWQVSQNIQFSLTRRDTGTFALILSEQSDNLTSFNNIQFLASEEWCLPKPSCWSSFSQPQVEAKVQPLMTSCLNSRLPNH